MSDANEQPGSRARQEAYGKGRCPRCGRTDTLEKVDAIGGPSSVDVVCSPVRNGCGDGESVPRSLMRW